MTERALVTGGAGFIGRRLVRRMLDAGWDVTVLDALLPGVHGPGAAPPPDLQRARFVHGDVRDADAWRDALSGDPGVIYHLAAETGTGESMYRSRRYVETNVGGTALLCDLLAAGAARPRRVVLAGSRSVYGEGPYACPSCGPVHPGPRSAAALAAGAWDPRCPACGGAVDARPAGPDTRLDPTSVYALTKRDQEELLHLLLPPRGVEALTLRLQNVYGPGQSLQNPYTGILSIFSVRLLDGAPVSVFEDGRESRDFVFVDDVVEAFARAAGAPLEAPSVTLDVGSGVATSVFEVAHALAGVYGADPALVSVTGEYRLGDVRHAFADTGALARVLGDLPRTPLAAGLAALGTWVRAEERPASALDGALDEMRERGLLGKATDGAAARAPAGGASGAPETAGNGAAPGDPAPPVGNAPERESYEKASGRDRFFRLLEREMAVLLDPATGRMRADWAQAVDCELCGAAGDPRPLFDKDGLTFVRCHRCGLVYMDPRPSAEALESLYRFESQANDAWVDVLLTDAEEAFQSADFGQLLDRVARVAPPPARLLDVGCSVGRLLRIARERGYDVQGLELGERAVRHAREAWGLPVEQALLDEAAFEDAAFDVVTLVETLEHVPEPRALLRDVRRVLRPGGAFLVGVPNVGSLGVMALGERARTFNRNHLVYYHEGTLSRLLAEEGFEVVDVSTAVTVLDSVMNAVQGLDPFGAPRTDLLPPRLRSELEDPGARAALEERVLERGLGYRLRVVARRVGDA